MDKMIQMETEKMNKLIARGPALVRDGDKLVQVGKEITAWYAHGFVMYENHENLPGWYARVPYYRSQNPFMGNLRNRWKRWKSGEPNPNIF